MAQEHQMGQMAGGKAYGGQEGYAQPPPVGYAQGQPGAYGQGPPAQGQPGAYGQGPPAQYGAPPPQEMYYGAQGGQQQPPMPPGGAQPNQIQWMAKPQSIPGCPPGLEYLTQIDQLLVHQQVELFEAFTNWETKNRYQVKNSLGQQVYFAAEESDTCARQCCGPQRGFTMHITDNMGQEVIRVTRPFKCMAGCNCCAFSDCCAQELEVESPVGTTCGYVKQSCSCLAPKYHIFDAQHQEVLTIQGPTCICQGPCCTWDQEFVVGVPGSDAEVGKISKQWSGFVKEYFTKADNFGVSFPMDLDVKIKAVMLGAVFLIDFMFFEQQNNN